MVYTKQTPRFRRKKGIRMRLRGTAERPRMTIFRSSKHVYAQVINDSLSQSLAAASTLHKDVRKQLENVDKQEAAGLVGKAIAEACLAKGIKRVVFDRNGYVYHGRVQALANAAREAGLDF